MLLNEAMLNRVPIQKSADEALITESLEFKEGVSYDLFISHSFRDQKRVLQLRNLFKDCGFNVYVDWIDDSYLNRENVTSDTADLIKRRIAQSKALAYVATQNITASKWCPWELGIADGLLGKVCIIPFVSGNTQENIYHGFEYLGLYPYLDFAGNMGTLTNIRVAATGNHERFTALNRYTNLRTWLNGGDGYRP